MYVWFSFIIIHFLYWVLYIFMVLILRWRRQLRKTHFLDMSRSRYLVGVGGGRQWQQASVRPQPCCSYTSPPPHTGHIIIVCRRDFNIWFNGTWNFVDRITLQLAAKMAKWACQYLKVQNVNKGYKVLPQVVILQVVILFPLFPQKNIFFYFENVLQASSYVIIMHHSIDHGHGHHEVTGSNCHFF